MTEPPREPMQLMGKARKVTIIVGHAPGEHGRHRYLAILETLRAEGAAGATAFRAMASFGARSHVHTVRLADVSPDLPVMIVWVDTPERVERILPKLWDQVTEGLITIEDTEVLLHTTAAVPDLPRKVPVSAVMTRDVVAVHPETPMSELVRDLVKRHFRAVPVIDAERRVVGIVTSGDLVRRGLGTRLELLRTYEPAAIEEQLAHLTRDARQTREVMTAPAATIGQDAEVREAAELMRTRNWRRLPVVDAGGRLVGLLSRVDLLRALPGAPSAGSEEEPHPQHVEVTAAIRSIMSTRVPTVSPDASLSEVLNTVMGSRMRRAVVIDEQRRVLGIIRDLELTDRLTPEQHEGFMTALMHHLPFSHGHGEANEPAPPVRGNRARDLMLTDIVMAREDEPIADVLSDMMQKGRTIAPVVNEAEELVGVVYRTDVLDALVDAQDGV